MKYAIIIASFIIGASLIVSGNIVSQQIGNSTEKISKSITDLKDTKVWISGGLGVTQREGLNLSW